MLSGETAKGVWPVETVKMMAAIIQTTEESLDYQVPPNIHFNHKHYLRQSR